MKKVLAFVAVVTVLYSVYFDLNIGTLPSTPVTHASEVKIENKVSPSSKYKTMEVRPGDTVLTIVERLQKQSTSVSIDKVILDFKQLNNGIKPEEIQIGQIYKFPVYP